MALYRKARIPGKFAEKTIEAFAPINGTIEPTRQYLYELYPNFQPGQRGILLMGTVGTGKTHLAASFIRELILERGIPCRFQDFAEMLALIRDAYARDGSEMDVLAPLIDVDVLLIDDLGKGRNTKWELQVLDILISGRYNAERTTLVTTNYTNSLESTLRERFRVKGNAEAEEITSRDTLCDRVGERIFSRLREMCKFFELKGEDYRLRSS